MTPEGKNAPNVLTKATISASGNLDLVTTTLFAGAIRVFDEFPGVTLYASAASSNTNSQVSTKYSDVQMLIPEGGTLGLYLSPYSQNPFTPKATQDKKTTGTAFGDRGQVVDRYYLGKFENGRITSSLTSDGKVDAIDDPVTLMYMRDGIGAKMVDRTTLSSSSGSPGAMGSTGGTGGTTPPSSSSTNYGLATSAYLGLGVDGGLLGSGSEGGFDAGVFRLESLFTATWVDRNTVLTLYPNLTHRPQDVFYGFDSRISVSINSNIKASLEYAVPIGGSRSYVGKAVLFGVTISQ